MGDYGVKATQLTLRSASLEPGEKLILMRTLGIRELDRPAIQDAAEHDQVIGITNDHVLAAVLVPINQDSIYQLVDAHFSRIAQNIRRGEREVQTTLDGTKKSGGQADGAPTITTLGDVLQEPTVRPSLSPHTVRHVRLGEISGRLLQEAAERDQPIVLTTGRVVAGVIFPVSQALVTQLVEQNLSRILYNIQAGEKELATGSTISSDKVLD